VSGGAIDLNCDLGEDAAEAARDAALLAVVSSANVACGGHAGDEESMRRVVRAAAGLGVAVGAHPGYPDRAHFGRRDLELEPRRIADTVEAQILALRAIAAGEGVALAHVKPHGALYNRAAGEARVAVAIAAGVARVDARLPIFGLAGSLALEVWRRAGVPAVAEAFADRRYEADGTLRSRRHPDALIMDPAAAAEQAVRLAGEGWVEAAGAVRVAIRASTLCIHADTPGAVAIASAVRRALAEAGIAVRPLAAGPGAAAGR
jgi:UPF0271 protein